MQRRVTKRETITGTMPDVELVAIMEQALEDKSKKRYVVKVDNVRWNKQYKTDWANLINTINHWQALEYKYMPASDTFIFYKR